MTTNGIELQNSHIPPIQCPDSGIHSYCFPVQSQITSTNIPLSFSAFSSPSTFTSSSLPINNSDVSQYGGLQHSSCQSQSYSLVPVPPTQFFITQSPIQPTHIQNECTVAEETNGYGEEVSTLTIDDGSETNSISSLCPICGDIISGFHYDAFSCESCKAFFMRSVRTLYKRQFCCRRHSACLTTMATRKNCKSCRFNKCLQMGMKIEAIKIEGLKIGKRRTSRHKKPLPSVSPQHSGQHTETTTGSVDKEVQTQEEEFCKTSLQETTRLISPLLHPGHSGQHSEMTTSSKDNQVEQEDQACRSPPQKVARLIPPLLLEIMEVEYLWTYNEQLLTENKGTDFLSKFCNIADHRLYKIVKWCKSLPLFKNISFDDQISLLINTWCKLLIFSCCYRSVSSPGEIRVSSDISISMEQAKQLVLAPCIEHMLNLTQQLRCLRVDQYEYVAMKVIVLLSSDTNDLKEPEIVYASQKKVLHALQQHTLAHYPDMPSKFDELLLRMSDLQYICQVGKEVLSMKSNEGEGQSFNLIMELLSGDH